MVDGDYDGELLYMAPWNTSFVFSKQKSNIIQEKEKYNRRIIQSRALVKIATRF
jgi:hypothetical protein